jgi:amino acid adenylation domain-containing protein
LNYGELLSQLSSLGVAVAQDGQSISVRAPPGGMTAELKAAIGLHKARILDDLLRMTPDAEDEEAIRPDPQNRYEPFALTDLQQAYVAGQNTAFELGGIPTTFYIELDIGTISGLRIALAWQQLVAAHDMLRASVRRDGLQQIAREPPAVVIAEDDLSGLAQEAIGERLRQTRERMVHREQPLCFSGAPFDLALSRLSGGMGLLHIALDFTMIDLGSGMLLFEQLQRLLADPLAVPVAPVLSFRDYVLATRARAQSAEAARARAYWDGRLDTLPEAPQLSTLVLPEGSRPRFVHKMHRVTPDLWNAFRANARRAGVTPASALMSAYSEVLALWSRSRHFTLNVTLFARRNLHPEIGAIVGDFTDVVLLEVDARAGAFKDRAKALQQRLWNDLDHAEWSGVRVIGDLMQRRKAGRRALMPVVFTCAIGMEDTGFDSSGLWRIGEALFSLSEAPQIGLDHQAIESDGALFLNWDFVEALYPEGMIDAMFEAYTGFIDGLARNPSLWDAPRPVALPQATAAARIAYNATACPIADELLHAPFFRQAAAEPARVAIVTAAGEKTYGEIAERAAAVAAWLADAGVAPGDRVGILMKKGWEQIPAALGALAAGAVFVPIDEALPALRIRHLLARTDCKAVLCRRAAGADLPDGIATAELEPLGRRTGALPAAPRDPSEPAYIIFTSGSTGTPKGVTIDHRGAWNTCADILQRFGIGAEDRVLAISSLSFDLSIFDIFGMLSCGGALVIPEPFVNADPAAWGRLARQGGVTVWNSVPALMQIYAAACERGEADRAPLRVIMMSGDWIPVPLLSGLETLWPEAAVHSLGGATEASIWSITYPVAQVDPGWPSVPYGYPLANQTMHVLDEHMEPRPDHVVGDIYIGGAGLALCYWNDAERTDAAFVSHPRTGERLYRTGDLGRFDPRGHIEFLGRGDSQVKIGGFRIEIGEIEAVLRQNHDVDDALVVRRTDSHGNHRLIAYVKAAEARDAVERKSVDLWSGVFDATYRTAPAEDGKPNTAGWIDSFTQRPLGEADMREWLDLTIGRIERFGARRVLEIGCGVGLILQRIAPHCDLYVGSDISDVALETVRRGLDGDERTTSRVRLVRAAAHDIGDIAERNFDLVVLNSICQYFPSERYLKRVIDAAFAMIRPGGAVFVGDIRNLDQADDFYARLAEARGPGGTAGADAAERLRHAEPELLVSPDWFEAYASAAQERLGGAWRAVCERKAGQCDNELNRYRFDVSLVPGGAEHAIAPHDTRMSTALPAPNGVRAQGPLDRRPAPLPTDRIRAHLAERLPGYMVPAAFVPVAGFPLGANGKVDPAALPAPEIEHFAAQTAYAPPQGPVETALAALWADVLGHARVGRNDDFFAIGGNSMLAVSMLVQAEAVLGRRVDLGQMMREPTIASIARAADAGTEDASLVWLTARDGRAPIVLIHPIGGDIYCYRTLARHLAALGPVCAMRAAGLSGEAQSPDRVEDIAARYLAELEGLSEGAPRAICGWSFGAVVAYEMVRQIAALRTPPFLALIDSEVPSSQGEMPDDDALLESVLKDLGGLAGRTISAVEIDRSKDVAGQLLRILGEAGALPQRTSHAVLSRLLSVYRANGAALFSYKPVAIDCRALAIAAGQDASGERGRRWRALIGGVSCETVAGDHYSIMEGDAAAAVAARIAGAIAEGRPAAPRQEAISTGT